MSKKCPKCGNKEILKGTSEFAYCPACEYFDLVEKFPEQTVFDRIVQSEETLADKMVYHGVTSWDDEFYASTICDEVFKTRAEAFAATVARLKEVEK